MHEQTNGQSGFSLVEAIVALSVLTVGAVGMAAVFSQGLQSAISSPNELVATQKAAEAIESVFSARDSHTLTWAQIQNTSDGGIFLSSDRPMNTPGADGIVNTGDSGEALESTNVGRFTRKIQIDELTPQLRAITVIVTYPAGSTSRTYTLTSYISRYA